MFNVCVGLCLNLNFSSHLFIYLVVVEFKIFAPSDIVALYYCVVLVD